MNGDSIPDGNKVETASASVNDGNKTSRAAEGESLKTLESYVNSGSLYLIIDAIVHEDVAGFAAELMNEGLANSVPELASSEFTSEDAIPYVLKVSPRFWRFIIRDIWQQGDDDFQPSWGIFFELTDNTIPFNKVVEHWRRWYFVELPHTGKGAVEKPNFSDFNHKIRAVFRFFDPRLIDAFLDVSTDAEKASFFGVASRILMPKADGSAQVYDSPILTNKNDNIKPLDVSLKQPFTMNHEHLNALELRRLEQRIPVFREYLEKHFEDDFQKWKIKDRDVFIRNGLRNANSFGFLSERSAAGWLSLQLLYGADFSVKQPWAMNILKDKRHTVGSEDHADRLINLGFEHYSSLKEQEDINS